MKGIILCVALSVAIVFGISASSQATVMRSADQVTENTFGEYQPSNGIDNVSNQSGLDNGFTDGVTVWDDYFAITQLHSSGASSEWWGELYIGYEGYVIFDIGSVYTIDKLAIWNEDQIGIDEIVVSISVDGASFVDVGTKFILTNNLGGSYGAEIFEWTPTAGRFVRLDILAYKTSWNTASMGEIVFSTSGVTEPGPAPVPEPATLSLLGIGLVGLVGGAARKKLKKKAIAKT